MPRRARRSYPNQLCDRSDRCAMGRHRAAGRHPVAQRRASDRHRSPRDRQRPAGQTSHGLSMTHASDGCSANELCSLLFRQMES